VPLLNYTTTIPTAITVGQIQAILAKNGAEKILLDYHQGQVAAVAFIVPGPLGDPMPIRLPVRPEAVLEIMRRQKIRKGQCTIEHARRVAWRIVKDWVEAQMALLQTEMVTLDQLFLPYAVASDGRTIYEIVAGTHGILAQPPYIGSLLAHEKQK
jgi:hypothetical protein